MIALPKPDVRYRIQSDDFDTFLELYDTNDSSIVPRLAQRDSLLQQAGVKPTFVPRISLINTPRHSGSSFPLVQATTS